ncbi:Snf7-domain-containing protein [Cystobasidium minutum MCA 4210]|uniref:Snf7-domain-containing protein n=1 Tax=Cystobasidium minutum MCA 4210 TaxID=1397322 RepID=UPI0034CF0BEE|eukprot:jgi/Rhomi1/141344/e_gw1.2.982.1
MALASVQKFLFGPTPEERVKQWQQQIKKEARLLDREIRQLDGAQAKTKSQLKQLANKGDVKNAKLLAREVVRSNKQKDRLATSKARLNSINMQLTHQLSTLKITGHLQKSTEIMKLSNELVRLPQLQTTMRNMSMEMTKAGIMAEMVDDTMDALDEDEDELDEEANEEIDKVLFDITNGKLGEMPTKVGTLPVSLCVTNAQPTQEDEEESEAMRRQLDALLGQ